MSFLTCGIGILYSSKNYHSRTVLRPSRESKSKLNFSISAQFHYLGFHEFYLFLNYLEENAMKLSAF